MSQAGIIDVETVDPQVPTVFIADDGDAIAINNELEILASYVLQTGIPAETVGVGNSITTNIQLAGSSGVTDVTKAGLAVFDSANFSVDANGFVSINGTGLAETITGDSGGALSPTLGNWNILGGVGITTTGLGSTLTVDVTGGSSFTTGSVIFWGGSSFAEDNTNFFWDNTNNLLGIGTNTPFDTLTVVGAVDFIHTSTESTDHALEIDVNAAGFSDVKAIDIVYTTGALGSSEEDAVISINIDETLAAGGEIFGLEVLSTAISGAVKAGLKVGTGVGAISQSVGTFGNADSILNIAVDVTAALASGGAGAISAFVADNDTMTIGDAAKFEEIEVILTTPASGSGIAPTFEYSTGIGTWAAFGPIDGTNGAKNTGNISWQLDDITGWMTGAGGLYLIRWTRTRNVLATNPVLDEIQIAQDTEFFWDKEGDVSVNSLTLVTPLTVPNGGTGVTSLPQYSVVLGAGSSPLTSVGPTATAGQILQSAGVASNPTFSTATYPSTTTVSQILYSSATNTVTGLATANRAVLTTGATGIPVLTALATDGQVIIGSTAGAPAAATLTAGTGISITNASNAITIAVTGAGFTWTDVTTATQILAVQNGYLTDRGAGVVYTLPASASIGDEIIIVGKLGITTITPNANQQLLFSSASGTVGITGTAVGTNVGDCVTLVCITSGASTVWRAVSFVGNWTLN